MTRDVYVRVGPPNYAFIPLEKLHDAFKNFDFSLL